MPQSPSAHGGRPVLEFWYEFASTYSYLSAMRIEELATKAGVAVRWQPFLLGPIFVAQGWNTSPFNIYPAKGRYMVRDMERLAAERGLPFRMPASFPAHSLLAARIALIGAAEDWIAPFSRAVYQAQFGSGADIADKAVLAQVLKTLGQDAEALFARAGTDEIKGRLKAQSAAAAEKGLFGAPSFVTGDGELFWGDDRLEKALAWVTHG
jgi:2-hydroxychromene-2-carboxylate isomerase